MRGGAGGRCAARRLLLLRLPSGVAPRSTRRCTRLIGANPAEIVAAMQAFRSGQRPATVMDRIAKGFTDDEIKAIADWYGAQKD